MQRLLFIAMMGFAQFIPLSAHAAPVQTFPITEATDRGIDGCGYAFTLPADYRDTKMFVFVNDGDKGIVKIDGQIIDLVSADNQGKGSYESRDRSILVNPQVQIGQKQGMELWDVTGKLVFTINGRQQSLKVKGHMGC
jgi:hypothetical protein